MPSYRNTIATKSTIDYENAIRGITKETVKKTLKQLVDAGNVFEVVMSPAE